MTVKSVLDLEDDLEVKVLTIIDYHSCDDRVVKALDLKSKGVFPRRFEPYSQRIFLWHSDKILKTKAKEREKDYRSLQTIWTNQQEQKYTERQAGTVLWINLLTRS